MANNYRNDLQTQRMRIDQLRALDTRLGRLADNAPEREGVERDRTDALYAYDRVTADIHAYERATMDDEAMDIDEFVLHERARAVDVPISRPVLRRTDRILLPEDDWHGHAFPHPIPAGPDPAWPDPAWHTAPALPPAAPALPPLIALPQAPVAEIIDLTTPPATPPPRSPITTPPAPVRPSRSPRRGGKTKRKGKKRKSTKKRKGKSAKKTKKRK